MLMVNGLLCLEEVEIRSYLGNPSERQMYKLRGRYELPFVVHEGARLYPVEMVNKWILGPSAHLYPVHQLMKFCTSEEASEITKKSWYALAHDRSRGKGLPYFYVGRLIRYAESDLIDYAFQHPSS